MYGLHPAMYSNLAMNSIYSPLINPFLFGGLGNMFGPMNPVALATMTPMMHHWFNPMVNPMMNPFNAYEGS